MRFQKLETSISFSHTSIMDIIIKGFVFWIERPETLPSPASPWNRYIFKIVVIYKLLFKKVIKANMHCVCRDVATVRSRYCWTYRPTDLQKRSYDVIRQTTSTRNFCRPRKIMTTTTVCMRMLLHWRRVKYIFDNIFPVCRSMTCPILQ